MGADRIKKIKLPEDFVILSEEDRDAERRELIRETMNNYEGIIPSFGSILCFTERLSFDDEEDDRRVYNLKGNLIENPSPEFRKIHEGKAVIEHKGNNLAKIFRGWR